MKKIIIDAVFKIPSQSIRSIGIVAVRDDLRENYWKAYIGIVNSGNEEMDTQAVAQLGCQLTEKEARGFFPNIELTYRK